MDWKIEYKELFLSNREKKFPQFFKDCDDPGVYLQWPKVKTSNGLTKAIVLFLTWKGHYANRINTQGQAVIQKIPRYNLHSEKIHYFDKVRYNKSTSKKGTPDIDTIINGRAVKIEVKVGLDKMSGAQVKQQGAIEAAGGLYYVAREMQEFYDWYYTIPRMADPWADPDMFATGGD